MDEMTTSIAMIVIFCAIGIILPVFLMIKDENKNPQSALPNKLILWITMVFCMILVFGIVVDFQGLSEKIREDIIHFGFVALMLFGVIFGIDQLLKSRYIKTVKWKDLTVETSRGENKDLTVETSRGEAKGESNGQGKVQKGDCDEPESGDVNVESKHDES